MNDRLSTGTHYDLAIVRSGGAAFRRRHLRPRPNAATVTRESGYDHPPAVVD